jgi:hypothetical protein
MALSSWTLRSSTTTIGEEAMLPNQLCTSGFFMAFPSLAGRRFRGLVSDIDISPQDLSTAVQCCRSGHTAVRPDEVSHPQQDCTPLGAVDVDIYCSCMWDNLSLPRQWLR